MYVAWCYSKCFVLFYVYFFMAPSKLTWRHCVQHLFFIHLFDIYYMGIWPILRGLLDAQLVQRTPSHICFFDMTSPTIKAAVKSWCRFSYRHSTCYCYFTNTFTKLAHTCAPFDMKFYTVNTYVNSWWRFFCISFWLFLFYFRKNSEHPRTNVLFLTYYVPNFCLLYHMQ